MGISKETMMLQSLLFSNAVLKLNSKIKTKFKFMPPPAPLEKEVGCKII